MERTLTCLDSTFLVAICGADWDQIISKDPLAAGARNVYHNTGSARALIANRVSYMFDLHGPSTVLDTGCSGSLVALDSACQSLRSGEAEMALAGGVGLILSPAQMILLEPSG